MSAGSEQVAHPILTAAEAYVGRGWSVLPVPYRSKSPVITGWPQLRITAGELPRYFGNGPQNISILLGDASGGLVDVDLDHPLAVELADQFLPETTAVFGRAGKPRSHRFYRVQPVPKSRVFRSPSVGTLVEIRSGGLQTIVPPSTHVGGDAIEWDEPDAEPATIMTEELIDAVERLERMSLISSAPCVN